MPELIFDLQRFNDGDGGADQLDGTTPPKGGEQAKPPAATQEEDTTGSKPPEDVLGVKPGQKEQASRDDKPPGAPESYADFTMPEGFTYDAAAGTEFCKIAKELNLTQAQAQKLVDFYGGTLQAQQQAQAAQSEAWYAESVKKFKPEEIALANRTLSRFADKEFIDMLKQTGLSNNAQVIGLFKSIGSQISEGKFVDNNGVPPVSQKSAAEVLYPGMK